jgi:hypothetical protein
VSRESVSACCKTAMTALILANAEIAVPSTGGAAFGKGAACDWCDAPLAGLGRGLATRRIGAAQVCHYQAVLHRCQLSDGFVILGEYCLISLDRKVRLVDFFRLGRNGG